MRFARPSSLKKNEKHGEDLLKHKGFRGDPFETKGFRHKGLHEQILRTHSFKRQEPPRTNSPSQELGEGRLMGEAWQSQFDHGLSRISKQKTTHSSAWGLGGDTLEAKSFKDIRASAIKPYMPRAWRENPQG